MQLESNAFFCQANTYEFVVCKIRTILFRPQYINKVVSGEWVQVIMNNIALVKVFLNGLKLSIFWLLNLDSTIKFPRLIFLF